MPGSQHRRGRRAVLLSASAAAVTAAGWAAGAAAWGLGAADPPEAVPRAGAAATPPDGLVVARARGGAVDVVAAVDGAWRTIVPAAALPPPVGDRPRQAEVAFVAVAPGLDRAALTVLYCAADASEAADCYPRGYVYDRGTGQLAAPGDENVPVGWLPDGRLLVDAVSGGAAVFDPATGLTAPVGGAGADYTVGFGAGLARDGGRIAYSTGTGEHVADLATGAVVALAGPGSADRTPWLAFSPDGARVAAARRLAVDVDAAGFDGLPWPSVIAIHDAASGARLVVVDQDGAGAVPARDLAPAWTRDGGAIVFLRADRAGQGADLFEPARVMRHDLTTGETVALAGDVVPRRDVVVAPTGDIAVWLEQPAPGVSRARAVDIATGAPVAVLPDDAAYRHTALAWADPGAASMPATAGSAGR